MLPEMGAACPGGARFDPLTLMSGKIPHEFIDELLGRTDIVAVIDARVPLKKKGREYLACCPFHTENTPSFTVSPVKQFYHCFGCGAHGTAIGFLMEYERLEFPEAVEILAAEAGLQVPREGRDVPAASRTGLDILQRAAGYYMRCLRESAVAIDYLKSRGLSGQVAADFQLGYAPEGWDGLLRAMAQTATPEQLIEAGLVVRNDQGRTYDRFRDRIMFPIRDRRGRVIAFGGRILGEGQPKYLNSPETGVFHKGQTLYGLFEALNAQPHPQRLLLVEGYMDVVALAQGGISNVVATLGTATTRTHLQQIFRACPEVVFCFDGDRAGREAAWRAVEQLLPVFRDGLEARFLLLPEGEDPDSLVRGEGSERFDRRVASATPFADFLFDHLQRDLDLRTESGRAALAQLAGPLLQRLPAGVFRELMFRRLSQLAGVRISPEQERVAAAPAVRLRHPPERPVRRALSLLLHNPQAAAQLPDVSDLRTLDLPGLPLLLELLEIAGKQPDITPVALVERQRFNEYYPHLLKLLDREFPKGVSYDAGRELHDAVQRLRELLKGRRVEALIQKGRGSGLSAEEKRELNDLLKKVPSHRPGDDL